MATLDTGAHLHQVVNVKAKVILIVEALPYEGNRIQGGDVPVEEATFQLRAPVVETIHEGVLLDGEEVALPTAIVSLTGHAHLSSGSALSLGLTVGSKGDGGRGDWLVRMVMILGSTRRRRRRVVVRSFGPLLLVVLLTTIIILSRRRRRTEGVFRGGRL